MRRDGRLLLPLVAALMAPGALEAQGFERGSSPYTGPPRGEAGLEGVLAVPVGEFADYVGLGGGVRGFGILYLDDQGTFGLRLDASWIVYGSTTVRRQLSPTIPFVDVDVTTENGIGSFGLGPHVMLGHGTVRPYLRGSVGLSYFATTTSVEGTRDTEPFASSTNFDDTTFALIGGGGLRVVVAEARSHPISLDVGATYMRHGETEYLREGGLRETPGGGVEIEAIRSETSLATFHLGVTVGIR